MKAVQTLNAQADAAIFQAAQAAAAANAVAGNGQ
jgi:hypothetical protein